MSGPWDAPPTEDRVVVFTPTAEDAEAATLLASRRPSWQWFSAVLLAAVGVAILFLPPGQSPAMIVVRELPSLLLLPLLWLVLAYVLMRRLARRANARWLKLGEAYRVSWNEVGITAQTPTTMLRFPWSVYVRRRENDTIALLYHPGGMAQFLPKRLLTPSQNADIRQYVDRIPLK